MIHGVNGVQGHRVSRLEGVLDLQDTVMFVLCSPEFLKYSLFRE